MNQWNIQEQLQTRFRPSLWIDLHGGIAAHPPLPISVERPSPRG